MDLWLDDGSATVTDPLDTVEAVIAGDERFTCNRAEDGDVHFSLKCSWGETVGYFSYREELPALLFTLGFDMQPPKARLGEAVRLAGLINENLWIGHFDVWSDDGTIIFRHAMPMIGRDDISVGEVQAMLASPAPLMPHYKSKRVRVLAYSGDKRNAAAPEVPTMKEVGVDYYYDGGWFGMFAPAKTPNDIVETLAREVRVAMQKPQVKERMAQLGVEPVADSPVDFRKFMAGEFRAYGEMARAAGIEPE